MASQKRPSTFDPETGENLPVRKREKYTRIACEICKARKVKCSGQLPCSRCVEMDAECRYHQYPTVAESTSDHSASSCQPATRRRMPNLSNPELGQLLITMKKVCDEIESSTSNYDLAAIPPSSLKRTKRHSISGEPKVGSPDPDYVQSLNLARDVLEQKGLLQGQKRRPHPATPRSDGTSTTAPANTLRAAKPLLSFSHDQALQFLSTFKDHVYPAYPCISLDVAAKRTTALYKAGTPPANLRTLDPGLDLIDVEVMKAVFSIALLLIGDHENPLAQDLMTHLLWNIDAVSNEERMQLEDVIMATLLTIYLILKNQPSKAWRMIGFASRACLELGMHKEQPDEGGVSPDISFHKVLFSCVYDLDKRCSFYSRLPWTLHDKDIDANVLSLDNHHPYLSAMLALNRVHTEIIHFNATAPPSGNRETDGQAEVFDYRLQRLVENMFSKGLSPTHASTRTTLEIQSTMCSIVQLRANQIRVLAYMRILSACDNSAHKTQPLQQLISLAVSSVDICLGMPPISLLWRHLVGRLLMASLSSMFLAVSQNPTKYGPLCRKPFHMAIDHLESASYNLAESEFEVWCSLDDLRRLGRKIQMPPLDEPPSFEEAPGDCFPSSGLLDGELQLSEEELAQLCGNTTQDSLSGLWDPASVWENTFNDFEMA
ncbi:hypothetical protein DER44DRAFT_433778 [Fusarium oxysporum]|nr:hypothetical protein DER44DRAFT_433778 [Fusarium oxysporum]